MAPLAARACGARVRARAVAGRRACTARALQRAPEGRAAAAAAAALTLTPLPALADAAAAAAPAAANNGWLAPVVDSLDFVLGNIEQLYLNAGVPYANGWSIVTLTALVKLATFPLTKKQVESQMSMQALKPRLDIIKERYGDDKQKIQKETSRLYQQAEVNPLAGCVPSLLQLPIFLGLFRSFSAVTGGGTPDNEGFYWLPSLSGPISNSDRLAGLGTAWIFPFVDGAPPGGWEAAAPYLVLPVLLVLAQYVSSAVISPVDPNAETATSQKLLIGVLPLAIGYFALTVPSALTLYYFSNTTFTTAQQIYFRKLGGASVDTPDLGPVTKLGMGRKTGEVVREPKAAAALPDMGGSDALALEFGAGAPAAAAAPSDNSASVTDASGTGARQADAAPDLAQVAPAEAAEDDGDIVGGLVVSEADMQGVAAAELEYLQRRCKRRRADARQVSAA